MEARGDKICLKGIHGKYCRAYPEGYFRCDSEWASTWEEFRVECHGFKVAIKGVHDKYVRAYPDGTIRCDSDWPSTWEEFCISANNSW
jgi:hypothetical protein